MSIERSKEIKLLLNVAAIAIILTSGLTLTFGLYYYPPEDIKSVVKSSFGKYLGTMQAGGTMTITFTPEEILTTNVLGIKITMKNTVFSVGLIVFILSGRPSGAPPPSMEYIYLYFDLKNASSSDIETVEISFRVSRNWITQNGVDEATIKMVRFYENSWISLSTQLVNEDDAYLYFKTESSQLSLFAIVGETKPTLPTVDWTQIFAISMVGIIVVGLAVYYLRKRAGLSIIAA